MPRSFLLVFLVATQPVAWSSRAATLTDDQVRREIIRQSVAEHHAEGERCVCPYDPAPDGSRCGGESAYDRRTGKIPICYPEDVSDGLVRVWRDQEKH
jgi:hypothetical protein